jgi:hypothetical protein
MGFLLSVLHRIKDKIFRIFMRSRICHGRRRFNFFGELAEYVKIALGLCCYIKVDVATVASLNSI